MLGTLSLLIVVVYSIYFSIIIKSKHQYKNSFVAKCIPMVLGMTSSVTIGVVIGVILPEMLALSTVLSIVLGAIIAIFIGKGFGLGGVLEAQSASFMGSMMGVMLGVMLSPTEISMMVVAMDFIYLVSIYSMIVLLNKDSNETKQAISLSKSPFFYLSMFVSVCVIAGAALLQVDYTKGAGMEKMNQHTHHHGQ